MKVHVLQHVQFEDLGCIRPWLEIRGAQIGYTRFFQGDTLPASNGIDLIIAMGGPMSVNDERDLPWLKQEKQFIQDAIAKGVSVLGVCLGAQLIASALGALVHRNPIKEIGWFPIQAVPTVESVFRFPLECVVFHWHGETFNLPKGAVRLAASAGCEMQAFQLMNNVIGLQFHLEATPQSVIAILENCRDELIAGPFVQRETDLLSVSPNAYNTINTLMTEVLSYLTRSIG